MLTLLNAKLVGNGTRKVVHSLSYRNLAPLYADEPMEVCLRQDDLDTSKYDVWIEGPRGGYAVKGRATVGSTTHYNSEAEYKLRLSNQKRAAMKERRKAKSEEKRKEAFASTVPLEAEA
jgi:hypothetical protein